MIISISGYYVEISKKNVVLCKLDWEIFKNIWNTCIWFMNMNSWMKKCIIYLHNLAVRKQMNISPPPLLSIWVISYKRTLFLLKLQNFDLYLYPLWCTIADWNNCICSYNNIISQQWNRCFRKVIFLWNMKRNSISWERNVSVGFSCCFFLPFILILFTLRKNDVVNPAVAPVIFLVWIISMYYYTLWLTIN